MSAKRRSLSRMTAAEAKAAYKAGKHSVSIVWPEDTNVTPEQQAPGPHHCPFAEGDPQRIERLKAVREEDNLIVTTGRDAIIERLDASPATATPSHMGLGTSSTAPAAGNTTLTGEPTRVALTSNTSSGGVLTMVGNWAAGTATGTWAEAGVFNALTTGTMYSRATFTAIPKGASDTLQITWTYTLTPS
jgi:hypothetical protein